MADDLLRPDLADLGRGPTAAQATGLTLAISRLVLRAALDEARQMNVAMSCAVVDSGDMLVCFERMDGADLVGVTLARDKAFTALVNRMPTGELPPLVQPGAEFYGYDSVAGGRTVVFAGGMPLEVEGVLVGAIGVSGGSAEQDARAAAAGQAALSEAVAKRSVAG
jgi:uncharacterized protein GlcG (DUF336 family)